ncbi:betacarotene 15,15 -monooxygenase [Micractinium conductrix]|uniref:Betacarotene 15,15 -monooxygenase n=1 Tax=Micractinium conductrix TaxID=554055 RepID=A0A2P6V6I3_9CHLO|nr:betacarotene 15,15 -monooxygenase [Micractinium conductrix]|eukprot:PSC69694.1 betacarotene 15,15 -monooxygenase [Micractinium conductrix]
MADGPHAAGLTGKCVEALQPLDLAVTGALPPWLDGIRLLRNGPGTFDLQLDSGEAFTVPHWFDGLTQLHEFSVEGGGVRYRSRHLYPALEAHIRKHGVYGTFSGCPGRKKGVLGALALQVRRALGLAPALAPKDPTARMNIGVTIGSICEKLYSKSDVNALAEIDPATLAPLPQTSYAAFDKRFKGFLSAAHGQRDEAAGTYYNYTMDLTATGHAIYHVFGIPDAGRGTPHLLASVRAEPAYVHSFAQTRRYIVLIVWPLLLGLPSLALHGAPGAALDWRPERGTRFYVIDKEPGGAGHVATFKSEPFFCFHTINAWEDEAAGALHIDLAGHDDGMGWFEQFSLPRLRSAATPPPRVDIRRYTLPALAAAVAAGPRSEQPASRTTLASSDTPGGVWTYELPRINKAHAMQPYRFVYTAAATSAGAPFFDAIAKTDVGTGSTQLWRTRGHFPGEPVFVARPGGTAEDDGLLLSVVLAGPEQHSYLLLLDAASLQEVARAMLPHTIGFGFHGNVFQRDGATTDLA